MSIFQGVATALITPFQNDKVDFKTLEELVDFQLKNNVNALVVNGTTGEPTTMTHGERTAVAISIIKQVNHKVPVILGAGSNNTYTAVEYAVEAEELGADGVLAVTPYYNKCTQQGLVSHYTAIAKSVGLPVIMYNVPGRTGVNIEPETALRLADIDNIVAINEASGNFNQFMDMARLFEDRLDLYSGEDGLVFPFLALGSKGVISVASNIIPQYMVDMCDKYFNGDVDGSRQMQFDCARLVKALFSEVNPIPVKYAMKKMGLIPSDYMRSPLTPCSKEELLNKELKDFGLIK